MLIRLQMQKRFGSTIAVLRNIGQQRCIDTDYQFEYSFRQGDFLAL